MYLYYFESRYCGDVVTLNKHVRYIFTFCTVHMRAEIKMFLQYILHDWSSHKYLKLFSKNYLPYLPPTNSLVTGSSSRLSDVHMSGLPHLTTRRVSVCPSTVINLIYPISVLSPPPPPNRVENSTSIPSTLYEFPNGYNMNLTLEKFKLTEGLFNASTDNVKVN